MTTRRDGRPTQAERRARTRKALLESAARGLARHGYANLSLERVAEEAGYTRGALYHQFSGKEDMAIAVVAWVRETWEAEVGHLLSGDTDPAESLLALARGHVVYCRRDVAAVLLNLQVEFHRREHPVGRAIAGFVDRLLAGCVRLIETGRARGSLPPGPPPGDTATALLGALEAVAVHLAGRTPHDIALAERAVRGVLALPPNRAHEGITT